METLKDVTGCPSANKSQSTDRCEQHCGEPLHCALYYKKMPVERWSPSGQIFPCHFCLCGQLLYREEGGKLPQTGGVVPGMCHLTAYTSFESLEAKLLKAFLEEI
jgi:hypothetical protein